MNPSEELSDELRTRAYYSQPVWKRIVVIAAGPAVNLVLAFILLFVFFFLIGPETATTKVGVMEKGYPAASVLKSGDRLVAIDGKRGDAAVFQRAIASHKCAPAADRGLRGDHARDRHRHPRRPATHLRDDARLRPGRRSAAHPARLRLPAGARARRCPFGESVDVAADRFWFVTKATLELPARLLDSEQRKEISGVVGSYETTRQSILYDVAQVVLILAIISLSLAIVNLFPFLPLDGGHIFWAIVEKVRGKPVPVQRHGESRRRRLHARDPDLPRRPDERHRPAVRRGLRRSR